MRPVAHMPHSAAHSASCAWLVWRQTAILTLRGMLYVRKRNLMRPTILALAILALLLDGFAIVQAVHAIANPVSCPGAFFGCPENGEESSYTAALWSDGFLAVAGLLSLIIHARISGRLWRALTVITFIVTVVVFPLPIGMVTAIFLSTVTPGVGVFGYLIFPLGAGVLLLAFGLRWPVQASGVVSRPSSGS